MRSIFIAPRLVARLAAAADADPLAVIIRFQSADALAAFLREWPAPAPRALRSIGGVAVTLPAEVIRTLSDRGDDLGIREHGIEPDDVVRGI